MIQITVWNKNDDSPESIDARVFEMSRINDRRLVWIDLVGDEPDAQRQFMQQRMGLPKLAVDDALRARHPPKFERLDDWSFLLMRGFDASSTSVKFGTIQLALFWRGNVVITRHAQVSASIAEVE